MDTPRQPGPAEPTAPRVPAPGRALVLFAVVLLAILGAALAAAGLAVPASAFVLVVLSAILLVATLVGRGRPVAGWAIGAGVAVLGLLAGSYSLAIAPEALVEGVIHIVTLARAATALASVGFLVWLVLAWGHHLRRRRESTALSPIGWR
jgi:hypothetical protein